MIRSFFFSAVIGAGLGLSACACGGAGVVGSSNAFGEWNDDQGASAAKLWNRLKDAPVARGADVAVGITAGKMIGVPLDGGARWAVTHALDSRPTLAAGLVVATGGGSVFAVDAKTGQKLWSIETPGTLRGAGDDGAITAVSLTGKVGSTLLTVDRGGNVLNKIETDRALGVPAVLGGVVFVPWNNQYVSALEAKTGEEIGRILVREKTSQAWVTGAHLYFGEVGIFRFDEKTRFASVNRASHAVIPPRELPGSPTLFPTPEAKVPLIAGARDRIRLYARAADRDGMLGLDGGRYFATYFRVTMGFDTGKGALAWVHTRDADVLGGAAGDGAFAACDAQGKISVYDARSGGIAKELATGEPLQACVVGLDGLRVPSTPAAPLAKQLADSLIQRDADLATAQRLLLRELSALEDETATKSLIDLLEDPKTPVPVAADARTQLAGRRNGSKFMIEALARHYDFLRDVLVPPPSGPIAQALAQIKDPAAPAPLASHLMDPATPDSDLKHVAAALAVIARPEDMPTLKQFFSLYQGTAEGDEVQAAVVSVAQGILKAGGKDGRALVEKAVARHTAAPPVLARLKALLDAAANAPPAPEGKPAASPPAAAK